MPFCVRAFVLNLYGRSKWKGRPRFTMRPSIWCCEYICKEEELKKIIANSLHGAMYVYRISDDCFWYLHFMTEPSPNSQQNWVAHLYKLQLYFYEFLCFSMCAPYVSSMYDVRVQLLAPFGVPCIIFFRLFLNIWFACTNWFSIFKNSN